MAQGAAAAAPGGPDVAAVVWFIRCAPCAPGVPQLSAMQQPVRQLGCETVCGDFWRCFGCCLTCHVWWPSRIGRISRQRNAVARAVQSCRRVAPVLADLGPSRQGGGVRTQPGPDRRSRADLGPGVHWCPLLATPVTRSWQGQGPESGFTPVLDRRAYVWRTLPEPRVRG